MKLLANMSIFSDGLPRYHRAVQCIGLYTLLGYLVVIICYLAAWCHPITAYWAVPVSECESLKQVQRIIRS